MRLPRDVGGHDLARALETFGYRITRRSGGHIRLTTTRQGEHHVTIPAHQTVRVGTLAAILGEVAGHFEMTRDEVAARLFGAKR